MEIKPYLNFYEFRQNNSGGSFTIDENVSKYVIIEARDENHAIKRAEEIGLYWNGVEDGCDCKCCGDRWYNNASLIEDVNVKKLGTDIGPKDEFWIKRGMLIDPKKHHTVIHFINGKIKYIK